VEPVLQRRAIVFKAIATSAATLAFIVACALPLVGPSILVAHSYTVAPERATVAMPVAELRPQRVRDIARGEVVLGVESTPEVVTAVAVPTPSQAPTPEPPSRPVAVAASAPLGDPPTSGIVIASWYGPGFYGNRTACGQVYTPEIIGVAHRTLPCGTLITIEFRGRAMTVPVIDRGPYIAGRTLDLSNATRLAMACPDLCTLSMRIAP
jgi:rare lipoprotein A (peptidoglycan hydrolase)